MLFFAYRHTRTGVAIPHTMGEFYQLDRDFVPPETMKDALYRLSDLNAELQQNTKLPKRGTTTKETVCDVCGKTYSTVNSWKRHRKISHPSYADYSCPVKSCKYTTRYRHVLERHHAARHRGVRKYPCELCTFTGQQRSDLRKHILRKHVDATRYYCYCGANFASTCTFFKHVERCVLSKKKIEKPYECSVCRDRFVSCQMLNIHLYDHIYLRGSK